jgi:hypothetical protein
LARPPPNTYNYPSASNLLASLTQSSTTVRSFSYDRAGNVAADSAAAPPTTMSTTSGTGRLSNGLVLSKIFTKDYLAELRVLVWDRLPDCL